MQLTFRATCTVLLLLVIYTGPASSEVPEGTWLLANRVAIQVFECSGLLCGKIVWLVRPRTPAGQPDIDRLNPDPALRQRPLCGLTIIWGLQSDSPGHWSNGIRRTATLMISPPSSPLPTEYPHVFIAEFLCLDAQKY